jgi:hypothetical protein
MTVEEKADFDFLLDRAMRCGWVTFTEERETGISSNSIVGIAYGIESLNKQRMPGDFSDLNACRNMWKKLPPHRKEGDAKTAMERAEQKIMSGI